VRALATLPMAGLVRWSLLSKVEKLNLSFSWVGNTRPETPH